MPETALQDAPADAPADALYVYYLVAAADVQAVVAAAQQLQIGLRTAHPGLQAALLRRPGLQDGHVTLMETYSHPGGLPANWQAAISQTAQHALAPWLHGQRHQELFVRLG